MSTGGPAHMRYGVDQARRGRVEAGDVPKTVNLRGLRRALKR